MQISPIPPFAWFRDALTRIAEFSMTRLYDLQPHRWGAARGEWSMAGTLFVASVSNNGWG
jgi:hypothetical protein